MSRFAGVSDAALSDPLFRSAHGTYLGHMSVSSETHASSSSNSTPSVTALTSLTNMTFIMDFDAMYNFETLGTDCTINATMIACSAAGESSANGSFATGPPHDCMNSCTLVLFNHASYTASFSQAPDGSFNTSTFRIDGGVNATHVLKTCQGGATALETAFSTRNILHLLAQQVDTR